MTYNGRLELSNTNIICSGVWKVFGPTPEHIANTIEPETTVSEILENTGHVVAVRDVSFDVYEGEIFCVMGLSGSGKSTLVRCMSRLIEPTMGEIVVNGESVTGMNPDQLRELRRKQNEHGVPALWPLFPPPRH